MLEPVRERAGGAEAAAAPEGEPDDAAAVLGTVVLAPLGHVEVAMPKRDPVRGRMRLEIRVRPRHAPAGADEPAPPVARPAAWPPVVSPAADSHHGLGGLVPTEPVLPVDRRGQPGRPGLEGGPERVPQPTRDDSDVTSVEARGEDRRAARIALAADVARRAAAEVETMVATDDDVVLLVPSVRQPRNEHAALEDASAHDPEPLEPPGLGDDRRSAAEDHSERRPQASRDDARAAVRDLDQPPDVLGRVQSSTWAADERRRMRQPARDHRDPKSARHTDPATRRRGAAEKQRERADRERPQCRCPACSSASACRPVASTYRSGSASNLALQPSLQK